MSYQACPEARCAGRTAQTPEEREILHKYAGFGGLKCILNDANELADAAKWSKSDIELFAPTVELRRLIHDYSHDDKEFNRYMESLKASTLTAFYTDDRIVNALADALKYQGVEVKKFLEPSAGQVLSLIHFYGFTPARSAYRLRKIC